MFGCSYAGKIYTFHFMHYHHLLVYTGRAVDLSLHKCRSNVSTIDPKYSLNILVISLFLKSISPFSFNIMLDVSIYFPMFIWKVRLSFNAKSFTLFAWIKFVVDVFLFNFLTAHHNCAFFIIPYVRLVFSLIGFIL